MTDRPVRDLDRAHPGEFNVCLCTAECTLNCCASFSVTPTMLLISLLCSLCHLIMCLLNFICVVMYVMFNS